MRVPPPDVSDDEITECVAASWGVRVDEISYAPVGFGSHHWHVTTDVGRLFVTVDVTRDAAELAAALGTALALHGAGLSFVHAPLPAVDGGVVRTVAGHYPLAVHRWIDGVAAADAPGDHTEETLRLLVRLHSVPPDVAPARRATLEVQERAGFDAAVGRIGRPWPGPYGEMARSLLRRRERQLGELFAIHDGEAVKMAETQSDWVVTHGEPHGDNLVVGSDGLHLIDWDTALIAPAARDVWQVGGTREAERYRDETGRELPHVELNHFRRDWDLAEVCQYVAHFAGSTRIPPTPASCGVG